MIDQLSYLFVDAFAASAYAGNVAAVVFDADGLSESQMQAIAAELNAGATAFVLKPSDAEAAVRLRWFSPTCELRFCGHATLAAAHALAECGGAVPAPDASFAGVSIECAAGVLYVNVEKGSASQPDTYWLDMPHCEPRRQPVNVPALCDRLGVSIDELDAVIRPIRTQDDDVILGVRSLQTLLELAPPMAELARFCRSDNIRGVLVTTRQALSRATAVQSRFFAPAVGIDEDAVSGSVHGPLGLHLVNCGVVPLVDGRADFFCAQARGGGRAGIVRVVVTKPDERPASVRIGGGCVTSATGTLTRLPRP